MSNQSHPIQVTCTFCGWKKVIRLRPHIVTPTCEQCGCDKLHQHKVGTLHELISWVRNFFYH